MNEERQFADKVCHLLECSARNLDRKAVDRLREARQGALARQRMAAVGGMELAGLRGFAIGTIPAYGRALLAALALFVGVVSTYYWQEYERAAEQAEVDSALLADEIPFHAYLDQDFLEWLDHRAQQESSQD